VTEILHYLDPREGFSGWLVYDGAPARLAAGGCRMAPGLTAGVLAGLASRMTLKQRVLGINVGGAKCGLDYDPAAPGASAALERFVEFLGPELRSRYSMGCDMGTRFGQLEAIARRHGIPSIKYAIRDAQGLTDEEYFERFSLLDVPVGMMTLGERRSGHALAHAALAAARIAGLAGPPVIALQGMGNIGRAAACTFAEEGARVAAVADKDGCLRADGPAGLDIPALLAAPNGTPLAIPNGTPLPGGRPPGEVLAHPGLAHTGLAHTGLAHPDEVLAHPCDVLVLAGPADALSVEQARATPARAVVVGANNGLSDAAERELSGRGILVVPDFIGGIGGSASMEALFGPERRQTAAQVLDLVAGMMHTLIESLATEAGRDGATLRQVAHRVADRRVPRSDLRAYGISPLLAALR
jgi:glutamate dehydrogenase/leucine dehydrogenase